MVAFHNGHINGPTPHNGHFQRSDFSPHKTYTGMSYVAFCRVCWWCSRRLQLVALRVPLCGCWCSGIARFDATGERVPLDAAAKGRLGVGSESNL